MTTSAILGRVVWTAFALVGTLTMTLLGSAPAAYAADQGGGTTTQSTSTLGVPGNQSGTSDEGRGLVGTTYLSGFNAMNLDNFKVEASDIRDAYQFLSVKQIEYLMEALKTNPIALRNSTTLTENLQVSGMLNPSERIVGIQGGILLKVPTRTAAKAGLR